MAISSAKVTVTTTAAALNTASDDWTRIRVANPTGGSSVYLGNSGVTTSNGGLLAGGTFIDLTIAPGDVLYAVSGGSQDVHVLRVS